MEYKCKECGKIITDKDLCYFDNVNKELIKTSLCFNCSFWLEHVNNSNNQRSVRTNNEHYWIASEFASRNHFRGFAGYKFIIHFEDGRKVISTNLWYQGEIPERFRDRLPNNCIFVKEENKNELYISYN